ncbi:MAG: AEC family transporter [Methylobacterium sp.]|nr:AEC family transporter [Methylobacterium sp.]
MGGVLSEQAGLLNILSIVFPVFAIVLAGWAYGRRREVEMTASNQLNMDLFVPALVFSALADQSFELAGHQWLALGAFLMIAGSGVAAWALARTAAISPKVLVPALMFNNCGNLGLPLAALAFGQQGLTAGVVMFLVSNLMHFSFGIWLLDHHARWWNLWRNPVILGAAAGLAVSFYGIALWPPLQLAIRMLGEVSIPLALVALGVRIAQSRVAHMRAGLVGGMARPAIGILLSWLLARLLGLEGEQQAMLIMFGALPPAMINYVFAERYRQGPEQMAAIVLTGNLLAVPVIPLVLALVL